MGQGFGTKRVFFLTPPGMPLVGADEPAGDADRDAREEFAQAPGGFGGGGQEAVGVGDEVVGVGAGAGFAAAADRLGGPAGSVDRIGSVGRLGRPGWLWPVGGFGETGWLGSVEEFGETGM